MPRNSKEGQPQLKPKRIDFASHRVVLENTHTPNQIKRSELTAKVINIALDRLKYTGSQLPLILYSQSGLVDDLDRIGTLFPDGLPDTGTKPVLFIYVGKNVLQKNFKKKAYSHLGQPVNFELKVVNYPAYLQLTQIVAVILEEVHHYVYRDLLPSETLETGDPEYNNQPHEAAAAQFVGETILEILPLFTEYLQYYGEKAED